jgi:adenylate cyclase class IV
MREVELKGVVEDPAAVHAALQRAGATLTYSGRLEDRRWDTPDRALALRDHVLRLRVLRPVPGAPETRATLDWKGPTTYVDGYKVREEHAVALEDAEALAAILERLGYVVTREIDREIEQWLHEGTVVRIERYPRMDVLAEVEGDPAGIERTIAALGIPRERFTTGRLPDFVRAYEERTGERAAICDRELDGDYRYAASDA